MGLSERLKRLTAGKPDVAVGDVRYDDWPVVRDFEDLETARAWCDHLRTAGIKAVLTSDYELDQFRRGDIALRVRNDDYGEAEVFLENLDL